MTRALIYSRQAEADLDEIFDFIAADNPRRARSYIEEIRQTCRGLCDAPLIGTARPDLQPDLRMMAFRRRVVIGYRVLSDHLEILRVFTGGRDYEIIMGSE
ncbi:MAG: type II toxin-antitoxin system RelE/ParE family toxin [Acetobacteraceae bacterium]